MSAQSGTTYGDPFAFTESSIRVFSGTGSPEGVLTGWVGDFYFRKDAGATTPSAPIYVKLSGNGTTTGWQALATTALGVDPAPIYIYEAVALAVAEFCSRAGQEPTEAVALGIVESVGIV